MDYYRKDEGNIVRMSVGTVLTLIGIIIAIGIAYGNMKTDIDSLKASSVEMKSEWRASQAENTKTLRQMGDTLIRLESQMDDFKDTVIKTINNSRYQQKHTQEVKETP